MLQQMDSIYIIRDAAFGRDFTPKLVMALVAIALALWDWRRQRRTDYLWVLLFGTVILALAEAGLKLEGIRNMPERVLLGSPLPDWGSYVLQGLSEGALVAVLGLFVGDRWLADRRKGTILGAVVLALVVLSTIRAKGRIAGVGEAASRRDMLDPKALVFLLLIAVVCAVFVWRYPAWRPRAGAMFVVMVAVAGVWTVAQTAIHGRWVEVDGPAPGTFVHASGLVSIVALTFDVVVEIALAYLPYLALPVMLGLLRDPRPLPRSEAEHGSRPAVGASR